MRTTSRSARSTPAAHAASAATLALLLASLSGCLTSGAATRERTVSEADFARLSAGQTEGVSEARARLAAARDELGRAKLAAVNGRHEGAFARSDQAAASAEQSRAAAETRVGQDSNEPAQLQQARDATRAARQDMDAADARLAYARKLDASLAAQVTAAERRVDLMAARVNLAKLQALEQAAIPAAGKYDRAGAQQGVADAERAHDAAAATAAEAAREAERLRPAP